MNESFKSSPDAQEPPRLITLGRADASASVTPGGSFPTVLVKPDFAGLCPSGVAHECDTMQLAGAASFHTFAVGTRFDGTLRGTVSG